MNSGYLNLIIIYVLIHSRLFVSDIFLMDKPREIIDEGKNKTL
jgi:hypothetical protein